MKLQTDDDAHGGDKPASWPHEAEGNPLYVVRFEPRKRTGLEPAIEFVRVITLGEQVLSERQIWEQVFAREVDMRRSYRWMQDHRHDWQLWGRISSVFGSSEITARMAFQFPEARAERLRMLLELRAKKRREREKRERKEQERREREKVIELYLCEEEGQFGLEFMRGGHQKGFFKIWFRERWERERLRDWLRAHRHRFTEFATFHEERGGPALERMLLREMLDTEKRLKAQGLAVGGRRPLRFYRGED
jgi:hypothetical protein